MIRTIVIADKNILTLSVPDEYVGKQVEVIAFTVEEPMKQTQKIPAKEVFKSLKFDTRGFKFNRDEANSR